MIPRFRERENGGEKKYTEAYKTDNRERKGRRREEQRTVQSERESGRESGRERVGERGWQTNREIEEEGGRPRKRKNRQRIFHTLQNCNIISIDMITVSDTQE